MSLAELHLFAVLSLNTPDVVDRMCKLVRAAEWKMYAFSFSQYIVYHSYKAFNVVKVEVTFAI